MRIAFIKLTIIGLTLLSASAFAADIPDAGRLLRESTPPPALTPPPKAPEIKAPAEPGKPALPDTVRIQVSGFVYIGNTVFTNDELNQIMAPAAGKELPLAELEQAVALITRAYRNKGYFLASALIAPQALKPGQPVTVRILEGRLEQIDLKTDPSETRTPRSLLEKYRNRLAIGEPVNCDQLTETALLLNELPALQSRFLLAPGTEPGGTQAVLEVHEGKPYSASLFADNLGHHPDSFADVRLESNSL